MEPGLLGPADQDKAQDTYERMPIQVPEGLALWRKPTSLRAINGSRPLYRPLLPRLCFAHNSPCHKGSDISERHSLAYGEGGFARPMLKHGLCMCLLMLITTW